MESELLKFDILENTVHALRTIIIHARAAQSKVATDAILDLAISRMPIEYQEKIKKGD